MSARRWIARIRIVIYVVVFALVVLFIVRFDLVTLPEEGCSPLRDYAPGDRLLVDRWVGEVDSGDALLFSAGTEVLLGVVGTIPASAPAEMHARIAAGAAWLVIDEPLCPGRDSRVLGPIESDAIEGRIRAALPW